MVDVSRKHNNSTSRVMRNLFVCFLHIRKQSNRAADRRLCICYIDNIMMKCARHKKTCFEVSDPVKYISFIDIPYLIIIYAKTVAKSGLYAIYQNQAFS